MRHVQSFQLTFHIKRDYIALAKQFAYAIDAVANKLNSESVKQHLQYQIDYTESILQLE
jgi:hypothetical protein